VETSSHPDWKAGDRVILNGWGVGETHLGAYAERARVKGDWLVPLPEGMSARDAMAVGTAGYTAMLCVMALERHGVTPDKGEIVVSGAAGGVGSIAIALLARLGYSATALSGRPEHADMLRALGAHAVLERGEFLSQPDKPLETASYAAAIDCVGGNVLGKLLRQIRYGGAVAALGNAAGISLDTNVLPFILRGVTLAGIDSVMQPYAARVAAWSRLAEHFDFAAYAGNVEEVGLADLTDRAARILKGQVKGRVLVDPRR
jgi:acrylyl-CoA reductase (NADPH)